MDEEGADLGRVRLRIELGGIAIGARVAAEQRASAAPAATGRETARRLDDEIAAVVNELRIDSERAAQRAFDLRRRVVGAAQARARRPR